MGTAGALKRRGRRKENDYYGKPRRPVAEDMYTKHTVSNGGSSQRVSWSNDCLGSRGTTERKFDHRTRWDVNTKVSREAVFGVQNRIGVKEVAPGSGTEKCIITKIFLFSLVCPTQADANSSQTAHITS